MVGFGRWPCYTYLPSPNLTPHSVLPPSTHSNPFLKTIFGTVLNQEHKERNGTERAWNDWNKNERGTNNTAEGPCSGTRNTWFKKQEQVQSGMYSPLKIYSQCSEYLNNMQYCFSMHPSTHYCSWDTDLSLPRKIYDNSLKKRGAWPIHNGTI